MELTKAYLVLIDISGYTKFIKLHRLSLLHAEKIISELIESIIESSKFPLKLNKLEGDAALFYANVDIAPSVTQEIIDQAKEFFKAFSQKIMELTSACSLCPCGSCRNVSQLKLKVFLHHGEIVIKKIRHFEEIAGENVILIHRFLKNSIKKNEYMLMSKDFYHLKDEIDVEAYEKRNDKFDGLGEVDYHVYYPDGVPEDQSNMMISLWGKIKTAVRLDAYTTKRLLKLTKPKSEYRHLEPLSKKT